MILADKIILQRKKAGWSQEELAEQLGVSRQSVSKWEGAQSIPDMDKLLKMSRLFGVSTDYLLKDEIDDAPAALTADEYDTGLRRVTMEEASDYLGKRRAAAPKIAFATFLCIISPIVLLIMAGLAGSGKYISSFIGFSPVDNAKVIAMCLIDEPQGIYYGGTIAAPVIRELFENILPYLEIQNN